MGIGLIVLSYNGTTPKISKDCFVAENVTLVGDIVIGEATSIWFGVTIRAEKCSVRIGNHVNVQDNCVIHTDAKRLCSIADGVSVGHGAIIHGATVGENTLVGMGSILLNGCKIGKNCIIGAGSLVTEETEIANDSMVLGSPAKVKRTLSQEEIKRIARNADIYDGLRMDYINLTKTSV
jgi:carbonic anhydrase/acetyltransferase-like protein (isoleucine patch superfamily)